jgi:hypothetical protein
MAFPTRFISAPEPTLCLESLGDNLEDAEAGKGCCLSIPEKALLIYGHSEWTDALKVAVGHVLARKPLWRKVLGIPREEDAVVEKEVLLPFSERLKRMDKCQIREYAPYLQSLASVKSILDVSWQLYQRSIQPSPVFLSWDEMVAWIPELEQYLHRPQPPLLLDLEKGEAGGECFSLAQCIKGRPDVLIVALNSLPAEIGVVACQHRLPPPANEEEARSGANYLLNVVCGFRPSVVTPPLVTEADVLKAQEMFFI